MEQQRAAEPPAYTSGTFGVVVVPLRWRGSYRSPLLSDWLRRTTACVAPVECLDAAEVPAGELESRSSSLRSWLIYGRSLVLKEIAASISHQMAVTKGLASGAEWCLILEDDAVPGALLDEFLVDLGNRGVTEPVLINLIPAQLLPGDSLFAALPPDFLARWRLRRSKGFSTNAQAYVMNRGAMQLFADQHSLAIVRPPDFPPAIAHVEWVLSENVDLFARETHGESAVGDRPSISVLSRITRWALRLSLLTYALTRSYFGDVRSFWKYDIQQRFVHARSSQ